MENREIIFIVDDDPSVRRGISQFLEGADFIVETFASSEEFLDRNVSCDVGCILLDVNMEGKSGLELQDELVLSGSSLPIIFISGYGDIPMSVKTIKKGAVNFLVKPFKQEDLLRSIMEATALSRKLNNERSEIRKAHDLIKALTPRELEILHFLRTGMLNKQIAAELSISERTVKLHRRHICDKFGVTSIAGILSIADKAGIRSIQQSQNPPL
jgi:FixJ family two-component response regulator